METEIIVVDCDTQTVSARELHKQLEVTDRFSRWFERMLAYGFVENQDFTGVKSSTLVNNGAEIDLQDYQLSVDMAKHICMVQRTKKAKEVRQYLIDLEKAWNTPEQVMARALKLADKTIEGLKTQLLEAKPKVDFFNAVADSKTAISMNEVAKVLAIPGYGRNNLFEFLREQKILDRFNVPYQRYVDCGWFRVIEQKYIKNGEPVIATKTLVYQKDTCTTNYFEDNFRFADFINGSIFHEIQDAYDNSIRGMHDDDETEFGEEQDDILHNMKLEDQRVDEEIIEETQSMFSGIDIGNHIITFTGLYEETDYNWELPDGYEVIVMAYHMEEKEFDPDFTRYDTSCLVEAYIITKEGKYIAPLESYNVKELIGDETVDTFEMSISDEFIYETGSIEIKDDEGEIPETLHFYKGFDEEEILSLDLPYPS